MITLREIEKGDNIFIASVCKESTKLYDPLMPGAFDQQAEIFEEEGIPEDYRFRIIYEGEEKVGFVGDTDVAIDVAAGKKVNYLIMLYLKENKYRSGIGSEVLKLYEAELKEQGGYEEITLLAHPGATWAKDFYRKNGYKLLIGSEHEDYKEKVLEDMYIDGTVIFRKKL